MKDKIKKIKLYFVISFCLSGCSTFSPTKNDFPGEKFSKVNIGDSEELVTRIWGSPEKFDSELYTSSLRVMTYNRKDSRPDVFFTVDPNSKKVVGKALWVYPESSNSDLKNLIDSHFITAKFQTYQPCKTRSDSDKILVDESSGLYIATEKDQVILIAWATPELTKDRVRLLFKKCPKLQPAQ